MTRPKENANEGDVTLGVNALAIEFGIEDIASPRLCVRRGRIEILRRLFDNFYVATDRMLTSRLDKLWFRGHEHIYMQSEHFTNTNQIKLK